MVKKIRLTTFALLMSLMALSSILFPTSTERQQLLTDCSVEYLGDGDHFYQCTWTDSGVQYKESMGYDEFQTNVTRLNTTDIRTVEHPLSWITFLIKYFLYFYIIVEISYTLMRNLNCFTYRKKI